MNSFRTVIGVGLILACPEVALTQEAPPFSEGIVGIWRRADDAKVTITKGSNSYALKVTKKGVDQYWKQVGKTEPGKPIKFGHLPRVDELPDETEDEKGAKITIPPEIKDAAVKTKGFEFQVEFDKIDDWGKCGISLHGTYFPGSIKFTGGEKDTKAQLTSATVGGKPKDEKFQRFDPLIYFVDGVGKTNANKIPTPFPVKDRCAAKIYKFIYPGSSYDTPQGRQAATNKIQEAKDFYAPYCIDLTEVEVKLPDATADKLDLKNKYAKWYNAALAESGGDEKTGLGKGSLNGKTRDFFHGMVTTLQSAIQDDVAPKGTKLVVVFMDYYIGGSSDTLVSSTQEDVQQIGISTLDKDSQNILAHELIHALGKPGVAKPGPYTWKHCSNCATALSNVGRLDKTQTVDLSGRYLDITEYNEIIHAKSAGTLSCEPLMK